ncbi:hypothetical protein UlMin_011917 [Ulmus minor]
MKTISSTLLLCLFQLFLLLGHGVVELQATSRRRHFFFENLETTQSKADQIQPFRTAFHFQPAKNWMNDPCAPMVYNGVYHLFYQHNPQGALYGNIVWGHSTSKDLVNWSPQKVALWPSHPFDANGCWTGSATVLPDGKPAILYTGTDANNNQVQNIAIPKNHSDPNLSDWIKLSNNPIMPYINADTFRDPTTAWKGPDGRWRIIIGAERKQRGLVFLFKSKDFVKWTKRQHPLLSSKESGLWECPDFFPVAVNSPNGMETSAMGMDVKHVFKTSFNDDKHDYYTIGKYNVDKEIFTPDDNQTLMLNTSLKLDYGKVYASKTFFDSTKARRISWGWVPESASDENTIKQGWAGLQTIPRTIWLDKSEKHLVQWPVPEIQKLRSNRVKHGKETLEQGSKSRVSNVTATQADVEVLFEVNNFEKAEVLDPSWNNPQILCSQKDASVKGSLGPFGLLVLASKRLEEYTAIFFRIFKTSNKYRVLMCSDQSRSSLTIATNKTTYGAFLNVDPVHEALSLRTLIDHSIVESFGGKGKAAITARVYPSLAINNEAHLYVFNNGTESVRMKRLNAWSMKKARIA